MPEVDDEYVDPISLKKVSEMTHPVISPHTGHVYEKATLVQWISLKGKDPIDKEKTLTTDMLVSGFVVKKTSKKCEDDVASLKAEMAGMKGSIDALTDLIQKALAQNKDLKQENEDLKKENAQLKKENVKAVWTEFGSDIDKKIKKGSSEEREKQLKSYATKVKAAKTEDQLKAAVEDTETLKSEAYSKRRFFKFLGGTSDTTRVVSEFQDKVTASKGW